MNSLLQLRAQVEVSKSSAENAECALKDAVSSARRTAEKFERLQFQYCEQLMQFAQENRPSLVTAVAADRLASFLALAAGEIVRREIAATRHHSALDALSAFSSLAKAVQVKRALVQCEAGSGERRGPADYLGQCLSQMDMFHGLAQQSLLECAQVSAFGAFEDVLMLIQNGHKNWHFGLETYAVTALQAKVEA